MRNVGGTDFAPTLARDGAMRSRQNSRATRTRIPPAFRAESHFAPADATETLENDPFTAVLEQKTRAESVDLLIMSTEDTKSPPAPAGAADLLDQIVQDHLSQSTDIALPPPRLSTDATGEEETPPPAPDATISLEQRAANLQREIKALLSDAQVEAIAKVSSSTQTIVDTLVLPPSAPTERMEIPTTEPLPSAMPNAARGAVKVKENEALPAPTAAVEVRESEPLAPVHEGIDVQESEALGGATSGAVNVSESDALLGKREGIDAQESDALPAPRGGVDVHESEALSRQEMDALLPKEADALSLEEEAERKLVEAEGVLQEELKQLIADDKAETETGESGQLSVASGQEPAAADEETRNAKRETRNGEVEAKTEVPVAEQAAEATAAAGSTPADTSVSAPITASTSETNPAATPTPDATTPPAPAAMPEVVVELLKKEPEAGPVERHGFAYDLCLLGAQVVDLPFAWIGEAEKHLVGVAAVLMLVSGAGLWVVSWFVRG